MGYIPNIYQLYTGYLGIIKEYCRRHVMNLFSGSGEKKLLLKRH